MIMILGKEAQRRENTWFHALPGFLSSFNSDAKPLCNVIRKVISQCQKKAGWVSKNIYLPWFVIEEKVCFCSLQSLYILQKQVVRMDKIINVTRQYRFCAAR